MEAHLSVFEVKYTICKKNFRGVHLFILFVFLFIAKYKSKKINFEIIKINLSHWKMKMFSKTILFIIITLIITGTSAITYVNIPSSQFNNMKIRTVFQAIKAVVKDFDQRLIKKA